MTLSRETRTRLVHSIKASASGLEDLQIAEIIRQKGADYGYTPVQSWFGVPASIPCNNVLSFGRSVPARVELVHEGEEDGLSEEGSVYMEVQEVFDLPTLGDQSQTHEDTPADSVLVSEGNITSWLRAVPGDLARFTPSPPTLSSPPEVMNLSEMQRAAVQSPLPIHPPNHQSPPIVKPSPTRSASQPPERPTPIRLEVSPLGAGKTHGDSQAGKYSHSHHRESQAVQTRTVKRSPCLPARPFKPDVATLCARLPAAGAEPHYVDLFHHTILEDGISKDTALHVLVGTPPIVPNNSNRQEAWEVDRKMWKMYAGSDWFKNQELEPYMPHNGKSILTQWLDEVDEGIVCCAPLDSEESWCGYGPFKRLDRAVAHVRKHLDFRPFHCGGDCGQAGWYVPEFLWQSVFIS